MRKVYVIISYREDGKQLIEWGVFTSRKKAELFKKENLKGIESEIKTEILI